VTQMTPRDLAFRPRLSRALAAFIMLNLVGTAAAAQDTWKRRTNTQRFGVQQGIFAILGLDWRF
jgi:hypothetical protein